MVVSHDTRDRLIDRYCPKCRITWRGSCGDNCPQCSAVSEDYGPIYLGYKRIFVICDRNGGMPEYFAFDAAIPTIDVYLEERWIPVDKSIR